MIIKFYNNILIYLNKNEKNIIITNRLEPNSQ